jgi:hypothetical protein
VELDRISKSVLSCLTSIQIWLIPLVDENQSTYLTLYNLLDDTVIPTWAALGLIIYVF